jgi:hypothetical protein
VSLTDDILFGDVWDAASCPHATAAW